MKETMTLLEEKVDAILCCQSTTATFSDATPSSEGSYRSTKTILDDSEMSPVKFNDKP